MGKRDILSPAKSVLKEEKKGGFCWNVNKGKGGQCPHAGPKDPNDQTFDSLCRDNKKYVCPGW